MHTYHLCDGILLYKPSLWYHQVYIAINQPFKLPQYLLIFDGYIRQIFTLVDGFR